MSDSTTLTLPVHENHFISFSSDNIQSPNVQTWCSSAANFILFPTKHFFIHDSVLQLIQMYCVNNFTKDEDCGFFFYFSFVNECKMKNHLRSHDESVTWSSLRALCESQQPAVIGSSLARGDRAGHWFTRTPRYLKGHRSDRAGAGLSCWRRIEKDTGFVDLRSAACPEPYRTGEMSRSWV